MRVRYVVICERDVSCAPQHELEILNLEKVNIMNAIARNQYLANEKFQISVEKLVEAAAA